MSIQRGDSHIRGKGKILDTISWECWVSIDSNFNVIWECMYALSVIYLSFAVAYNEGTWNMNDFIDIK